MSTPHDHVLEKPAATIAEVTSRYGWVIVAVGFLINFVTIGSGRYLYPVVLPAMKDELGLSYGLAGALASMTMVGYLVSCLLGGILAVRFSPRVVTALATLALGIAMVAQSQVSWYPVVIFLMLVIGLGAGGGYIPTVGLVAAWFPPRQRGMVTSIVILGCNCGILATAIFGPAILLAYGGAGWRPAWVYFGGAAVAIGLLGLVTLRDRPSQAGVHQSRPSQSAAGPSRNWSAVFRNRSILGLTLAYLCHGFFSIYITFLTSFTTRGLGYSTEFAGALWAIVSVAAVITMVPWGHLSDRWGRKQAIIPAAAIMVCGILLPVFRQDAFGLYASAFLFGIAWTGPMAIITVTAGDIAGPAMAAAAMGLVTMGHGVGQVVGPSIGGFLVDMTGSFYPGLLISGAAIVAEIIIIATLRLPRPGAARV